MSYMQSAVDIVNILSGKDEKHSVKGSDGKPVDIIAWINDFSKKFTPELIANLSGAVEPISKVMSIVSTIRAAFKDDKDGLESADIKPLTDKVSKCIDS